MPRLESPASSYGKRQQVQELTETLRPRKKHKAYRCDKHFADNGFGPFAVERLDDSLFIGYVALNRVTFTASFTPCVEIGWRLSADHWGKGLATEGAREVARYAFEDLGLESLVAFTTVKNLRSRRVMEKLHMTYDSAEDFDHPRLPEGHPLRRHVLYRLRRRQH